jgi:hypothetical protein
MSSIHAGYKVTQTGGVSRGVRGRHNEIRAGVMGGTLAMTSRNGKSEQQFAAMW